MIFKKSENSFEFIPKGNDFRRYELVIGGWTRFIGRMRMNEKKQKYLQIFCFQNVVEEYELQYAAGNLSHSSRY